GYECRAKIRLRTHWRRSRRFAKGSSSWSKRRKDCRQPPPSQRAAWDRSSQAAPRTLKRLRPNRGRRRRPSKMGPTRDITETADRPQHGHTVQQRLLASLLQEQDWAPKQRGSRGRNDDG